MILSKLQSLNLKNFTFIGKIFRFYPNVPLKSGKFRIHAMNKYVSKSFSTTSRGKFSTLVSRDVEFFQKLLKPCNVILDPDELEKYTIDWLKSHKGSSTLALRPQTTEQVSEILKYCHERNLAVCPQGGNTGLVCGSTPIYDEIIVSLSLMKKVIHFDDNTGVLLCEAGCILENMENFVNEKDFTLPLDLGAKGSCQIGGNLSTNAGGSRFIRYGSLHGNVLGLKAVLAGGEILNCMNVMRKNNTGYDLKHLFIGSEGTLGIITEAAILCYPKSPDTAVALLGCNTFDQVVNVAKVVKGKLPELLSSLEMFDDAAADTVRENLKLTVPISRHAFYILVEISGSDAHHNEEKLNECLSYLLENNFISDGTVATDCNHMQAMWSVRERITEALLQEGCGYKYDISLPISEFYKLVEVMRERLGNKVTRCVGYGHLADGNIHFNATTKSFNHDVLDTIEPFIYKWTSERNGSISAEHGIGFKKKEYLHYNKTSNEIDLMRSLKKWLDPKGILNPYKVI